MNFPFQQVRGGGRVWPSEKSQVMPLLWSRATLGEAVTPQPSKAFSYQKKLNICAAEKKKKRKENKKEEKKKKK